MTLFGGDIGGGRHGGRCLRSSVPAVLPRTPNPRISSGPKAKRQPSAEINTFSERLSTFLHPPRLVLHLHRPFFAVFLGCTCCCLGADSISTSVRKFLCSELCRQNQPLLAGLPSMIIARRASRSLGRNLPSSASCTLARNASSATAADKREPYDKDYVRSVVSTAPPRASASKTAGTRIRKSKHDTHESKPQREPGLRTAASAKPSRESSTRERPPHRTKVAPAEGTDAQAESSQSKRGTFWRSDWGEDSAYGSDTPEYNVDSIRLQSLPHLPKPNPLKS